MQGGGIDRRPATGKGSLLYEIYKDRLDPDLQVPDAWMSIRRAAAFAQINQQLLMRQVKAGLLPTRKRGTRLDVNPVDVVKLNYDENGVRQAVRLETGERRPLRSQQDTLKSREPDIYERAKQAIMNYPQWVEEVDEFLAYADSHNLITTPRSNGTPISITNTHGDKTGWTAQILADMPKPLAEKAKWVRVVYEVVYRQRRVINSEGVTVSAFLETYAWGVNRASLEEVADMFGFHVNTAANYMKDIVHFVSIEATKYDL